MPERDCPQRVPGIDGPPAPPGAVARPALFLDRDGVINHDAGYTYRRQDFHFMPGVFALARQAAALAWPIVVITNQAGIARGFYDEAALNELSIWMAGRFRDEGAALSAVYFCPHHEDNGIGAYRRACHCRKPAPGMLLAARDALGLDLTRSTIVGDKASDIEAGQAAGVGRLVLLGSDLLRADLAMVQRVAGVDALRLGPA